jgi:hypothetical protein
MRVRIVCYDDLDSWIIGKFAIKLNECLLNLKIDSDIARHPDPTADINHHLIYFNYDGKKYSNDTLMITHIDNQTKLEKLKKQLEVAELGICMSRETLDNLVNLGVSRDKLSYINPAHDGVITPRPKVIGITSRMYNDGRKREYFLSRLAKDIDCNFFSFKIMGEGWDKQVDELKQNGFQVEYIKSFDHSKYVALMPLLDYYLYTGQDEGQMGFVDAVAAGVETIVTPQGYHLDAREGLTHSFNTYKELLSIFKSLQNKKLKSINSVATWTWNNYALKHVDIWEYLLTQNKSFFTPPERNWLDGIYSVEQFDKKIVHTSSIKSMRARLFYNNYKHTIMFMSDIFKKEGFVVLLKRIFIKMCSSVFPKMR